MSIGKLCRRVLAGAAVAFLLPDLAVATPIRQLDFDELDARIHEAMATMEVPGLALAVVDTSGVVLAKGYGVRAIDSEEPVDASTLFDIGSITKTFTATAVALLVDREQLAWSTTIGEYIPEFAMDEEYVTREFTLADALSHRGGYLDNYFYALHPTIDRSEFYERLSHSEPTFPFRAGFEYNNALYGLSADVLEVVTGRTWGDFVTDEILSPLGMTSTFARPRELAGITNRAAPHELTDRGLIQLPESDWREVDLIPSTGVIMSSADDMAKWCAFQLHATQPGVVPALTGSSLREMRTAHINGTFDWFLDWGYGRQRNGYGYGWMMLDYRDDADQHVAHGGATRGMQAWIVTSPKHGYAIAMMSNAGWAGDRVHFAIANWIHDRVLDLEPVDWTGELLAVHRVRYDEWLGEREPEKPKDLSVQPGLPLRDYAGNYDEPMWGPIVVDFAGSVLDVQMGIAHAIAQPWGGEVFYLDWDEEDVPNGYATFHVHDGVVTGLTYDDGWTFEFTRRR